MTAKNMYRNMWILGTSLALIGFLLIGFYSNWFVAGGVFLFIMGHNFEKTFSKKWKEADMTEQLMEAAELLNKNSEKQEEIK